MIKMMEDEIDIINSIHYREITKDIKYDQRLYILDGNEVKGCIGSRIDVAEDDKEPITLKVQTEHENNNTFDIYIS